MNCTIFKYRTALTRLRISAHSLEIERGRYGNSGTNTPVVRDLRFCRYCEEVHELKAVESEEHVLHECQLYKKFRAEFLHVCQSALCITNPGHGNTNNIIENVNVSFPLSKFCYKIFKYRKAFYDHLDDYIE